MTAFRHIAVNVVETLLRVLPFPCKTGLVKIGNPDRTSPVLLTCNFHLTVERVKRALRGLDCYLLVANSRGINVWCAATGGLLGNHDAISALRTSGIEDLVDHRNVILPQLAATGIEAKLLYEKTGWKATWGPVYAKDIPGFLASGPSKRESPQMRQVAFPWSERFEMAVAWAFPLSLLAAVITLLFWRGAALPIIAAVWALSLVTFLFFPLYSRRLAPKGKRVGFVLFDFGRGGLQLVLWGTFLLLFVAYTRLAGEFAWPEMLRWAAASFVIVLVLSLDLMGSTPVFKSGLHEDRLLAVAIDESRCRGVGACLQVCPRACFEMDEARRIVTMPGADRCVQCGACIVQCPLDALCFKTPSGDVISPETIRKYKLNMLGKRPGKANVES